MAALRNQGNLPPGVVLDESRLSAIYKYLLDMNFTENSSVDLSQPMLKPIFAAKWPLVLTVVAYSCLVGVGLMANFSVARAIYNKEMYRK